MVEARKDSTDQLDERDLIPIGSPTRPGRSPMPRQPLIGYNHDIEHSGRLYHVQTEDLGPQRAMISSQVYLGGAVVGAATGSYIELATAADHKPQLRQLMQAQHRSLLRQLAAGAFDARIAELSGELFPPPDPFATTIPAPSLQSCEQPSDDPVPVDRLPWRWRVESLRHLRSALITLALLGGAAWGAAHLARNTSPRAEESPALVAEQTQLQLAPLIPRRTVTPREPRSQTTPLPEQVTPADDSAPGLSRRDAARSPHLRPTRSRPQIARTALPKRRRLQQAQRQRAIRRHLALARRAVKRHRWRQAKREARTVLRLQPRHRQARAIKRRAETKIRRIKRRRARRHRSRLFVQGSRLLVC